MKAENRPHEEASKDEWREESVSRPEGEQCEESGHCADAASGGDHARAVRLPREGNADHVGEVHAQVEEDAGVDHQTHEEEVEVQTVD